MGSFTGHDAYIAAAPEQFGPLLVRLRARLALALPDAEEHIMYDMPGLGFGKIVIAGYAAFSKQCGLYVSKGAVAAHLDNIAAAGLKATKTGVTFSTRHPIPDELATKLALASRLARFAPPWNKGRMGSTADDARFWDRTSRRYAKARISDQVGYERTLVRTRAPLVPEAQVQELTCGTGSTALMLADGVRSYLATDISKQMISIAEDKRTTKPIQVLAFRVATADDVAFEPEKYDAVLGIQLPAPRPRPAHCSALYSQPDCPRRPVHLEDALSWL